MAVDGAVETPESARPAGQAVAYVVDLDEQLRNASKMEALGRLASGVAHDFNNLLVAIRGYTELVAGTLGPDDPRREDLDQVLRAADRASEMTRKLLALGRQQALEPRVIDPAATIEEIGPLLRRLLGEDVELIISTAPGTWHVVADPGQIEQVIVNLAVNGRDAMPAGGSLSIELFNAELGEDVSALRPEIPAGQYVALAVSDTGVGMDADTLAHAFEPFYTTKAPGAGTGLGLSSVYGFVKQSGGFVYVGSEPGRGSDFTIYLPRARDIAGRPAPAESTGTQGGSETVLVVEDDAAVREFIRRVLAPLGYRLLVTRTASEAVESAASGEPIDLLIADVGVPDMRGPALAARLTEDRRGLRVLLISGYAETALIDRGEIEAGAVFLAKPFSAADLARTVRTALSGRL
jgi:two-component system cell cycle sensor histidine kinase/response regulator CckA